MRKKNSFADRLHHSATVIARARDYVLRTRLIPDDHYSSVITDLCFDSPNDLGEQGE